MSEVKKVVLAYSGGLDTSIIIPWRGWDIRIHIYGLPTKVQAIVNNEKEGL